MIDYWLTWGRCSPDKKSGTIELCVRFETGEKKYRSTRVRVEKKYWDKTRRSIKKNEPEYKKKMERIRRFVYRLETAVQRGGYFTVTDFEDVFDYNRRQPVSTFNEYYEQQLNRRFNIQPSTYREEKQTLSIMNRFNENIAFHTCDSTFVRQFDQFLVDSGYAPSTRGKHHKNVKIYIQKAIQERKINFNEVRYPYRGFKMPRPEAKKTFIYLSSEEIEKIHKSQFPYSKRMTKVKDLFVVSALTALRYSDLITLKKENIYTYEGVRILRIITMKTKTPVAIPLHPFVEEILKKYDYKMPMISNAVFNKVIKEVCRYAGIDNDVEVMITHPKKKKVIMKKYELVTAHTGRRSGATNMYLAHINTMAIMKITGHTSEKNFMNYIKASPEENALSLSDSPFFHVARGKDAETDAHSDQASGIKVDSHILDLQ